MVEFPYNRDGDVMHACYYCGSIYYHPTDRPSVQYMWEGHAIMECEKIPERHHKMMAEPQLKA